MRGTENFRIFPPPSKLRQKKTPGGPARRLRFARVAKLLLVPASAAEEPAQLFHQPGGAALAQEVAQPAAGELDLFKAKNGGATKSELRIVETEFLEMKSEE